MNTQIIRSKKSIQQLIGALNTEAASLPPTNIFGESNAEDKEELLCWVTELEYALKTGSVLDFESEAGWWLTGKDDFLGNDYGVN